MSAPVLTKEQSHSQMYEVIEAARVLAQSHETLRAECEAVRADRDSLWTTVNKVKAERDAALAEVARMRPVVHAAMEWHLGHGTNAQRIERLRKDLRRTCDSFRAKEPDHA